MKISKLFPFSYQSVVKVWLLSVFNNISIGDINCSEKSPNGDCPTTHVPQMIKNAGYQPQLYHFMTEDGYNLTEIRIRGPRDTTIVRNASENIENAKRKPSVIQNSGNLTNSTICEKPAVLFVHGLMADSSSWIMHDFDKAIPYVLTENGYDVWLHNTRGTKYSQQHMNLTTKDSEFWNFSYIEMGNFDIPAAIAGIIEITGCEKIFYIGHSLGTTQFFSGISMQPELNTKITAMFALAPISYLANVRSVIALAAPISPALQLQTDFLGHFEFGPKSTKLKKLKKLACTKTKLPKVMCQNLIFRFDGNDKEQVNEAWYETHIGHFPAPTSSKTIIHLAQGVTSKRFALYDYRNKNFKKYNQTKPPDIDLKNVIVPVHLFTSENDLLSVAADVNRLREGLPNVKMNYTVPFKKWNHMDFLIGKDINKYVNEPLLKQMKEYK